MVVHTMPFSSATSALVGASNSQWLLIGISDADDRIARLQRMSRTADSEPTLDVTVCNAPAGQTIAPPRTSISGRRQRIFSLADTGESAAIAAQMGASVGEVDLILKRCTVQPKTPTPSEV